MKCWNLNLALVFGLVAAFSLGASPVNSQESGKGASKTTDEKVNSPSGTFNQIKALIKKSDWESAAKLMTDQAADEAAAGMVTLALSMTAIDAPIPMPQLDDAKEAIEEVLKEHGMDKLGIEVPAMFQIKMGGPDEEDDESTESPKDIEKLTKENNNAILAALNKSGKRWKIVSDINKAVSLTPFGFHSLSGKAVDEEVEGDISTLKVEHDPDGANRGGGGGVQIVIQGPPRYLNFVKENSSWKYAGIDSEKTAEARKNFSHAAPSRGKADF